MTGMDPAFPPLINGIATRSDENPLQVACTSAEAGVAEAGDLFWSPSEARLIAALVLEPDITVAEALEAGYIAMVAFGDCLGALAPPEVGVMYRWPSVILVNGAVAGTVSIRSPGDCAPGHVPDWMVVGLRADISPQEGQPEPGQFPDRTTLWDEGCGELTRTQLLESFARHLKTWFHRWEVDGSRPVREAWLARSSKPGETVRFLSGGQDREGTFLGLDEAGNLLAKCGDETITASLYDNLKPGGNEYDRETIR